MARRASASGSARRRPCAKEKQIHSPLERSVAAATSARQWTGINYRMGGVTLNRTKDRLIDNALDRQGGYAAEDLASQGISYQQQGQLLGNRFDAAKEMYAATGDRAYHKIARDLIERGSRSPPGRRPPVAPSLRRWNMWTKATCTERRRTSFVFAVLPALWPTSADTC